MNCNNVPSGVYWIVESKHAENSPYWYVVNGKWHFARRPASERAKEIRKEGRPVRLVRLVCNHEIHDIV